MTIILIIVTACVSILIWELLPAIYRKWIEEEPIKHYQPERHEYPKKEEPTIPISFGRSVPNYKYAKPIYSCGEGCSACNPDNIPEMDKIAIEKNDKEYELAGGCLVKKDCECDCSGKWKTEPEIYFHDGCQGHVPLTHYMSRGNKRYFRGENVKVVVTVKGGGCENS